MLPTSALASLLLLAPSPGPQEARPVASRIVEVTVYGGSASIRREAVAPAGDGELVLRGLPHELDPASVRVRASGGEIVGVEVRDRYQESEPDPRVQELRGRIRDVERELAGMEDERRVAETMREHLNRLLLEEERDHRTALREGRVDTEALEENYAYLRGKLVAVLQEKREIEWRIEAKRVELNDLRLELGRFEVDGGVRLKDVTVDLLDLSGQGGTLEVEYVVSNAGWQPYYDLRAKKDLSQVELAYRARVWQRTGEDWRDASIVLSTAQPQRGAQGPDPQPIWLSLEEPAALGRRGRQAPTALESLGYADEEAPAAAAPARKAYAEVSQEGLSVRFRLPRAETIESRSEPTTVLIGRTDLALDPEHYVVPALDTTVWLRARAENASPWVMLPGQAAVYFGADFVGHARLDAVQVGQEFTLHLGADPGLVVTRTKLEDLREGAGIFSSKATQREAWRIELENAGAFSPHGDGAVDVLVQEVLPRAKDDRIKVTLKDVRPKPSEDERWKKEREEKGVLTWVVRVAKGAKQRVEWASEVDFPENMRVVRRR